MCSPQRGIEYELLVIYAINSTFSIHVMPPGVNTNREPAEGLSNGYDVIMIFEADGSGVTEWYLVEWYFLVKTTNRCVYNKYLWK